MIPYSFRYLAGHALLSPSLKWRHHGIGVLQAYLHEGDTETRIHVWHPALVLADFNETNGLVHDHRFDFDSYVLLGSICNTRFQLEPDPTGEWVKYGVTHARKALEEYGSFSNPLGLLDEARYTARRETKWYGASSIYSMKAREFHMSHVNELTVTLIVKTGLVDGSSVIIGKRDVPLIHAFEHPETDYRTILNQASNKLLGAHANPG
jgi:hypothetical protein